MYEARQTAGVLPRCSATSATAAAIVRFRAASERGSGATATATAASTVACQVRKSLAVKSSPAASLR